MDMSLFPEFGGEYYDEKNRDILSRMKASYDEAISPNQTYWMEGSTDQRFYSGDQTLWSEMYGTNIMFSRRRQFNFNRIRRVVNMVSGHQRRNRKSTIVTPVENGDAETADQFSKILLWINNQESVLETISEAFEGSLVTGMNLLQVWVDYRADPVNGNIKVDNCSYNSFLLDPFFRKADLSDCNYLWKRSYLTRREVISLLPDYKDELSVMQTKDTRDGKFQFQPESSSFNNKTLLAYDEYHYRDYRTQRMIVDTQTGELLEWKFDEDKLRQYLAMYPTVTVIEQEIPTTRLAIVVQGRCLYDGPNVLGIDQYPFVPVWAYYAPQMQDFSWRIQGITRGLRDAQYLYNHRKRIELDILESQINSGFIYKEESLINPSDVFLTGQGKGLALKSDAQMTDVQQIVAPQIPPSMLQLSEVLGREIMEVSGVNEELLGSATDEKAGILSMLRQGAGLTTLQGLFDQLDRSQRMLGKIMIDVIQANFTPGKVQRIIEEQPAPQFYNKSFGKYDANVEEGLNTTSQRQMQFAQLLQLREVGVPIPDDVILEACTVQNKKKLMESINASREQQQQMAQQQQEAQIAETMARTELAQARATADRGLGLERMSRIEENESLAVERQAQAGRDENEGLLALIKAIKEIDGMDIEHIERITNLANSIKQQDREVQDKEVGKSNPVSKEKQ
jgi:hypothetical protein